MNQFKYWWQNKDIIEKSGALTFDELSMVRRTINKYRNAGKPSSYIISKLQEQFGKLSETYKAERAFWTELKRMDTSDVGIASDELKIDKFRVILSPNACPQCRKKTDNGSKVFSGDEMEKDGYGHVPPFHPNCYCIIVPK